jgi:UDP-glucose 4-epimerase
VSDNRPHLILGGCGFIGRHVAVLLARGGDRVVVAARAPPAYAFPEDVAERISWVPFRMEDIDWDTLIEGVGAIHHYAWSSIPASANRNPAADLAVNVTRTLGLLEALRRQGQQGKQVPLIFASSGGTVYGALRRVPARETDELAPLGAHGAGKAAAELYLGVYRSLYGLDCRIARIANPFGAGQDPRRGQGAATTFLYRALAGQPITVWGDGEVVRDYIHVADAAAGLVALTRSPRCEGRAVFNIANGKGVSLNAIIAELRTRRGRSLEVHYEPGRGFDVPVSVLDVTLAREVLGWSPRLSFAEGLSRTLADLERSATFSTLDGFGA